MNTFFLKMGSCVLLPFPFQRLAFDQPNIALLYFPFVWLPCCTVPLVLLSHIAMIRKLVQCPENAGGSNALNRQRHQSNS